jgi:hypothetical protein
MRTLIGVAGMLWGIAAIVGIESLERIVPQDTGFGIFAIAIGITAIACEVIMRPESKRRTVYTVVSPKDDSWADFSWVIPKMRGDEATHVVSGVVYDIREGDLVVDKEMKLYHRVEWIEKNPAGKGLVVKVGRSMTAADLAALQRGDRQKKEAADLEAQKKAAEEAMQAPVPDIHSPARIGQMIAQQQERQARQFQEQQRQRMEEQRVRVEQAQRDQQLMMQRGPVGTHNDMGQSFRQVQGVPHPDQLQSQRHGTNSLGPDGYRRPRNRGLGAIASGVGAALGFGGFLGGGGGGKQPRKDEGGGEWNPGGMARDTLEEKQANGQGLKDFVSKSMPYEVNKKPYTAPEVETKEMIAPDPTYVRGEVVEIVDGHFRGEFGTYNRAMSSCGTQHDITLITGENVEGLTLVFPDRELGKTEFKTVDDFFHRDRQKSGHWTDWLWIGGLVAGVGAIAVWGAITLSQTV